MPTTLRVLIVEDSEDDAALLLNALRRGRWKVSHERVDTSAAMTAALNSHPWDLIIADYSMPHFSGPDALALAVERAGDVPFILVSGVVSEETAVQAMKAGADDYFSKGNFARLVPAVERELYQASARRKALLIEQQLRKREIHLAKALQLARVGTWHLDINSNTAVWSDEARRILGFKPENTDPVFNQLLDRLYPKERAVFTDLLRNPSTKQFSQDFQLICANGSLQFVNVRGDVVRDRFLVPLEAAGTIQDITDRKIMDAEIERAHVQLTEQNLNLVALTEQAHGFVDDVSHEFRTPLTVIKEFSSIIADGLAGPVVPEQIEYLHLIDNATLDLNQMVEDFLDSSKLRAGYLRVDRRRHNVEDIFQSLHAMIARKAATRHIKVQEFIASNLPPIFADEEKVRRVILNLMTNAIKFSAEGSTINLRAECAADGDVRIAVSDQGEGLTPDELERIYTRFQQCENAKGPGIKGFGLGLSIARELTWLNLGRISVESKPGIGSTFAFTVPTDDPVVILNRYIEQLEERNIPDHRLALLEVTSLNPDATTEDIRGFLATTCRPMDIVLVGDNSMPAVMVLGAANDPATWIRRMEAAAREAVEYLDQPALNSLHFRVLHQDLVPTTKEEVVQLALEELKGVMC